MNQASQYLLALAKRNIKAYIANPKVKAAMVTGSVALGISDCYSDIDMSIYYSEELPSSEELEAARQQNQSSELLWVMGDRSTGAFAEGYLVRGVECQFGHVTIARWEKDMNDILAGLNVTSPLQKALSGVLICIPLYGEALIEKWQRKIADYPDVLAKAMVNKHLNFFALWACQELLAVRDTTLFQHQIILEAGQNILGVLAGLNRLYYSTFQIKRMGQFIEKMNIAPKNLYDRLESLYRQKPLSAAGQLKELVAETVELVELHVPEIDTSQVRRSLARQQRIWTPQPNPGK